MTKVFDPIVQLWDTARKGIVETPQVSTILRCEPEASAGYPIRRDRMYFEIRVNELHLADNRQWWSIFDPMVVVVAEYSYAGERVARPAVVGPSLIRSQSDTDKPRHGVVLQDCLVVGPHPYRGGNVELSVSFYRVQRTNAAASLLKVIDGVSGALGGPSEMATVAKVGGVLLEGVEGLLGLQGTTYLAGSRLSLTPDTLNPLRACFSTLITPPAPPSSGQLKVRGRRLYIEDATGERPYRDSDFVLLGVSGSAARGDESSLPFYAFKEDALAALADGDEGKKRGKAHLITAYQQMRKSPDITSQEAGELFEQWLEEFKCEERRYQKMRAMPVEHLEKSRPLLSEELNAAVNRLEL